MESSVLCLKSIQLFISLEKIVFGRCESANYVLSQTAPLLNVCNPSFISLLTAPSFFLLCYDEGFAGSPKLCPLLQGDLRDGLINFKAFLDTILDGIKFYNFTFDRRFACLWVSLLPFGIWEGATYDSMSTETMSFHRWYLPLRPHRVTMSWMLGSWMKQNSIFRADLR